MKWLLARVSKGLTLCILFLSFGQCFAIDSSGSGSIETPKGLNQLPLSRSRRGVELSAPSGGLLGSSSGNLLGEQSQAVDFKDSMVDPETYVVNVGDKIQVALIGGMAESYVATVTTEGHLIIPKIGKFKASGKLLKTVKEEVFEKLSRSFKNLTFDINLVAPRTFKIFVLGEVANPQAVTVTAVTPLSEAIQMAGNIKPTGSLQRVKIQSGNGVSVEYDLQRFLRDGELSQNPNLLEGQTVFVPVRGESVYIGGGIEYPGSYEIGDKMKVLSDLIHVAKPMKVRLPKDAALKIQRIDDEGHSKEIEIALKDLEKRGSTFELLASDIVQYPFGAGGLAPTESDKVYVSGEVLKPGVYPFSGHLTFQDYIGMSGGLTLKANFKEAKIVKKNGVSYNLEEQPRLEPGDTLYVPELTFKFWQDHLTIITSLLTIFGSTVSIIQLTR